MNLVLTRGTVRMDIESCKGCDLCIPACRPGVLQMTTDRFNQRGFRYPELSAGCTGCQACAVVCPDYVFEVWKYDPPIEIPDGPVSEAIVHREVEAERHDKL